MLNPNRKNDKNLDSDMDHTYTIYITEYIHLHFNIFTKKKYIYMYKSVVYGMVRMDEIILKIGDLKDCAHGCMHGITICSSLPSTNRHINYFAYSTFAYTLFLVYICVHASPDV